MNTSPFGYASRISVWYINFRPGGQRSFTIWLNFNLTLKLTCECKPSFPMSITWRRACFPQISLNFNWFIHLCQNKLLESELIEIGFQFTSLIAAFPARKA
jgi:hypothetical protein